MQKKLIAIAIAAALAPAAAMADSSNVVIYGKMHMSYDRIDVDTASNDTGSFISNNSSRLGFKGSEDLGDGLKAVWQYEVGLNPDTAAGGAFASQRDTFLGLSGNFGTVTAGRQAWHNLYAHDANMFSDQIGAPSVWIDRGGRTNNSIKYATPNTSGFSGSVTYVTPNGVGNGGTYTNTGVEGVNDEYDASYAFKASYSNGPIFASLTHLKEGKSVTTAGKDDMKSTSIAGGYDFGAGKVVGQFVSYSDDANIAGKDKDIWTIGGSYNVTGMSKVKAQYTKAKDSDTNGVKADDGAKMFTVGYDYSLSKRTTAYVAYSRVSNDTLGTYNVTGSGQGAAPGNITADKDPTALSLGLVHDF
jgi:predicted porin